MDCSLPGFSVHGIFQARILEWVAISCSRGSSGPRNWTWSLTPIALAGDFFKLKKKKNRMKAELLKLGISWQDSFASQMHCWDRTVTDYGICGFSSVQSLSRVRLFATLWTAARQASLSITNFQIYSNPCPLSQWCHATISDVPFSSHLQSFPAPGHFPTNQFFTSGGQSIGVSASASVLPKNIQGWFPLQWIGWISLQSEELSTVFSNTTVQKHQFFSAQLSLESNSHIYTWPLKKP